MINICLLCDNVFFSLNVVIFKDVFWNSLLCVGNVLGFNIFFRFKEEINE